MEILEEVLNTYENTEEVLNDYKDRELEDFTIDELKEQISQSREYIDYCRDLIAKKQLEEFDFHGKYIKVREMDSYTYLRCDICKYSTDIHGKKCIYIKGIGFSSDFGPYEDSNYVHFCTWDDIYINYHQYEMYKELRESGKENRDYYTIVEISKEEYQNEFYKLIDNTVKTFETWKE